MSIKKTADILSDGIQTGCKISGGVLRPTLAPVLQNPSVISTFTFAEYAAGAKCVFASDGNCTYLSTGGKVFYKAGDIAGDFPFLVEDIYGGKARATFFNGINAVSYSEGKVNYFTVEKPLSCGVMHCGRLFGVDADDGLKLTWSGEGFEKLNGEGSIILDPERGEILDLVVFGGKLVAVRKRGLTVLNMYGSPENFSVAITDTDTDEILRGTAKTTGGALIFATSGGLCSFDGNKIKRLGGDISPRGRAAVYSDRYFIGCDKGVLCYDTRDGLSFYIDIQADALCAAEGIFAYTKDGVYTFEEGSYTFEKKFDFGSGGNKTVTKIYIGGTADLQISNGRLTRIFSSASGTVRPNLRGESFTVRLTGSSPVTALNATAEVMDAI